MGQLFAQQSVVERFLFASWLVILTLIPFHAVISTWGGAGIGPLEVWKSWKEILLLLCLAASIPYLVVKKELPRFFGDPLFWLIIAYVLAHLVAWAAFRPETDAALAGLLMNLRFFGMFLLTMVLLTFVKRGPLLRVALFVICGGGVIVILFGLLQATILPDDFLRHFGYSKDTIAPVTTLDNNHAIVRLQSTLRGPNPLGQYLIVIILLLAGWWRRGREVLVSGGIAAALFLLFATYSRSAWIGMVVAGVVFVVLRLPAGKVRRIVLGAGASLVIVAVAIAAIALPHSTFLQNTILHNKHGDTDKGSTVQHWNAGERSLQRIADHPMGQGPGSAGPASFYGSEERIAENYYLQITEEVGVIGIALFVAINAVVVTRLWRRRQNVWVAVWLASFAGISVVNLFLHGWADDTIAIMWWSFAPILFQSIDKKAI